MCGHWGSPFSAALPGTRSFMRSLTCTHPCMLHCLPRPCDHCVCVAECSAGAPAVSPGRLGCPAGNAEQCAVCEGLCVPIFGVAFIRDQGFLWLCLLKPCLQSTVQDWGYRGCAVDGGDIAFPHTISLLCAEATLELPLAQSPRPVAWVGRVHLLHLVAME